MKIKVTTERDCCAPEDLVKYTGQGIVRVTESENPKFCKYCGQLWVRERVTDAAGDRDWEYNKPKLEWK